jgi:hypothetical protein
VAIPKAEVAMRHSSWLLAVQFSAALLLCGRPALSHASGPPQPSRPPGPAPRFEVYCDPLVPGRPVAEIQWPVATGGELGARELAALLSRQSLEVTVYKEGFARGLFKTVQPAAGGQLTLGPPAARAPASAGTAVGIQALQNLVVADLATTRQPLGSRFRMRGRGAPDHASAIVRIEGLEPGMRYFWRVSSPGASLPTFSFLAPACPVDTARPPGRP